MSPPVLAAFAFARNARLHGLFVIGAHWMGFTFVADRTSSSRLLSTFPRGNAVAGPSSLNGLISDMSFFISSGFEFQDRTERERVGF